MASLEQLCLLDSGVPPPGRACAPSPSTRARPARYVRIRLPLASPVITACRGLALHADGRSESRAARHHRGAYRAGLVSETAAVTWSRPGEVGALAEDAAAEIARFDAELGRDIAPFSAVLLRSEPAASSNVENVTASARSIAEAETLTDWPIERRADRRQH